MDNGQLWDFSILGVVSLIWHFVLSFRVQ